MEGLISKSAHHDVKKSEYVQEEDLEGDGLLDDVQEEQEDEE